MAPTINHPILPPSTPLNRPPNQVKQQQQHQQQQQQSLNTLQLNSQNSTPTTESRMNPPSVPRSLMTPSREMRESSVVSATGGSARKPRQNLDERDHILMVKLCNEQRGGFKEGTKAQFWAGVNAAFQQETGKILAQMSATVGRLVETRRRQLSDWENGITPQKPGGELNDRIDEWMEFLRVEDGDAEAERMRQVEARRKVEEARKEARRQAIAAESQMTSQQTPTSMTYSPVTQLPRSEMAQAPPPPPQQNIQPQPQPQSQSQQQPHPQSQPQLQPQYQQPQSGTMVVANGDHEVNGYRPNKRKRQNERALTRELQTQIEQQQWEAQQGHHYALTAPPEPPRRVVVEGQLTKDDWRDIMGNDARLRALETKVEKIEVLVSQNNKLLLQLVQNQNKDRDRNVEEERVPVHLDAEFERDYL